MSEIGMLELRKAIYELDVKIQFFEKKYQDEVLEKIRLNENHELRIIDDDEGNKYKEIMQLFGELSLTSFWKNDFESSVLKFIEISNIGSAWSNLGRISHLFQAWNHKVWVRKNKNIKFLPSKHSFMDHGFAGEICFKSEKILYTELSPIIEEKKRICEEWLRYLNESRLNGAKLREIQNDITPVSITVNSQTHDNWFSSGNILAMIGVIISVCSLIFSVNW